MDDYGREQMVFFADASRIMRPSRGMNPNLGGYAVCYQNINSSVFGPRRHRGSSNNLASNSDGFRTSIEDAPEFVAKGWKVEWLPSILHGEMLAIGECYRLAVELAEAGLFDGKAIFFSDCRKGMEILSMLVIDDMVRFSGLFDEVLLAIVEAIIWYARRLFKIQREKDPRVVDKRTGYKRGHGSTIHWIPGHHHDVVPHQIVDMLSRDAWMGTNSAEKRFGSYYVFDQTPWTSTLGYQVVKSLVERNTTDPRDYGIPARDDILGPWRNGEREIDSEYSEMDERRAFIEYSLAQLEAKERGLEDGGAGKLEQGGTGEAEDEEAGEVEEKTDGEE